MLKISKSCMQMLIRAHHNVESSSQSLQSDFLESGGGVYINVPYVICFFDVKFFTPFIGPSNNYLINYECHISFTV